MNPPKIRPTMQTLALPFKLVRKNKITADLWYSIYDKEVTLLVDQVMAADLSGVSDALMVKQFEEIFRLAREVCDLRFHYIIKASLLPMIALSLILKLFCAKSQRPALTDLIINSLDYKTSVIDREINRLAILAYQYPEVKTLLFDKDFFETKASQERFSRIEGGPEFLRRVDLFLRKYGYRTEKMYQPFSSISWLEDPVRFLVILKAAMQDSYLEEREGKETERKLKHEQWVTSFIASLKGPFKRSFKRSYSSIRENHVIREDTLFALESLFTAARKIAAELGKRWMPKGFLKVAEDIVFLTKEEIAQVVIGDVDRTTCIQMVRQRKKSYASNKILWKKTLYKIPKCGDTNRLKGLVGSTGVAKGPVRIITGVSDFGRLEKGDILVCPYTDPTWTPLFGMVAAVVTDTGGPLSHAAIVAREYGIPAILGTKVGTSFFQEGELVTVDGGAGFVYRIKE